METADTHSLYTDPWAWAVAAIFAAYVVTFARGLWLWRREEKDKKNGDKKGEQ
jgi:hypothetical protein